MPDVLPVENDPRIALLLTCADWRLHSHEVDLNARVKEICGCDGIDLVSVPGPDGMLHPARSNEWLSAVSQIKLLINNHNVQVLVVAAHHRCAGHPVSDTQHDTDVRATVAALKRDTGFSGPIHAIMLTYRAELDWGIEPVVVI